MSQPSTKWMTTFADLLSLLLTFFILLFAMSEIKKEEWEELTASLKGRLNPADIIVSQDITDVPPSPRIDVKSALNLTYVYNLLQKQLGDVVGKDVTLVQEDGRILVQLSSDASFKSSSAEFSSKGLPVIRVVASAVAKLSNKIEVLGHTDPRPINTRDYPSNWELSVARAYAVAQEIRGAGYPKPVDVYGMASGRYDSSDKAQGLSEKARFRLARRVDIVIMKSEEW